MGFAVEVYLVLESTPLLQLNVNNCYFYLEMSLPIPISATTTLSSSTANQQIVLINRRSSVGTRYLSD